MPPNGNGAHAHTWGTAEAAALAGTTSTGVPLPPVVTHLRFGIPEPPKVPIRARGGTEPDNRNNVEHQNRFAPLRQQGNETGDNNNEALNSGILRGGSTSAASSSKRGKGRNPIPHTPEILLLLDRLEPDKGKQARLLTAHLTG